MLLRTILLSEFSEEKSKIIASKTTEESTTWHVLEDYRLYNSLVHYKR
jgi:hypothetical protein